MPTSTFPTWQPIFLANLVKTGQVARAAQRAQITRQNVYLARSTRNRTGQDRLQALAFAQTWREAQSEYAKEFELAFRQRALAGTPRERHIYYKGKCVGVDKWRVYNNSLLIALVKSILPEKFSSSASVKSDLPDFTAQDLADREAIDNLASDLWCQVLEILNPTPQETILEEETPAASPQINFSPAQVSSLAEPSPTPIADEFCITSTTTDPIIFSPSQVSSPLLILKQKFGQYVLSYQPDLTNSSFPRDFSGNPVATLRPPTNLSKSDSDLISVDALIFPTALFTITGPPGSNLK